MKAPRQYSDAEWLLAAVIGVIGFSLLQVAPLFTARVLFWGLAIIFLLALLRVTLALPLLLLGLGGLFSLFGGDDDCEL